MGKDGMVGEFDDDIEEGIPYITGNVLWAVYQFITFIVLLSVLRARMVNTYHRIFREADVQWKFFRYLVTSSSAILHCHTFQSEFVVEVP